MGVQQKIARFAVGTAGGPRSSAWAVTAHGSDVYVNTLGGLARVVKFSFHESGRCQFAFDPKHAPSNLTSRALYRWQRAATPRAGAGGGSLVLRVIVPTDYLSTALTRPDRRLTWAEAAPAGGATGLDFVFTRERRKRVEALVAERSAARLVAYAGLPNGEAFMVLREHGDWENRDIKLESEAADGSVVIFSPQDPHSTGRPVRCHRFSAKVSDGGVMELLELGGYPLPVGSKFLPPRTFASGTISETST